MHLLQHQLVVSRCLHPIGCVTVIQSAVSQGHVHDCLTAAANGLSEGFSRAESGASLSCKGGSIHRPSAPLSFSQPRPPAPLQPPMADPNPSKRNSSGLVPCEDILSMAPIMQPIMQPGEHSLHAAGLELLHVLLILSGPVFANGHHTCNMPSIEPFSLSWDGASQLPNPPRHPPVHAPGHLRLCGKPSLLLPPRHAPLRRCPDHPPQPSLPYPRETRRGSLLCRVSEERGATRR